MALIHALTVLTFDSYLDEESVAPAPITTLACDGLAWRVVSLSSSLV